MAVLTKEAKPNPTSLEKKKKKVNNFFVGGLVINFIKAKQHKKHKLRSKKQKPFKREDSLNNSERA